MSNLIPITGSPSLNTPRDDQPASAWASSTLTALGPSSKSEEKSSQPADQTPELEIPGGFPAPLQGRTSNGATINVLETAKQLAQSAAQSAQTVIHNAGEKAGDYLPTAVASYLPSKQSVGTDDDTKTLPSQETSQNYHPSTSGGVGVLPGPPGETGVAILPDERMGGNSSDDVTEKTPIMTTTNNNPIYHSAETVQDDAKLTEERRLECMPSHDDETKGRLGKSDGVGALPGSLNESSVALLPDERNQLGERATSHSSTINNASTDASTRTLRSHQDDGEVGQIHLHDSPNTEGREHTLVRDEEKVFGSDSLKQFDVPGLDAKGQKPGDDFESLGKSKPPETSRNHGAVGAGSGGLAGAGDSGHFDPSTSPKKSGFIHKVKGEMKILSGKMSHNESKVEEGRKLAGKN